MVYKSSLILHQYVKQVIINYISPLEHSFFSSLLQWIKRERNDETMSVEDRINKRKKDTSRNFAKIYFFPSSSAFLQ